MLRINIERDKCISCLTCVTSCAIAHEGEAPRNRVVISSKGVNSPIFCRNCDLPECTFTCMTGAMRKDPDTGYVTYNQKQCAGCFMCIMACPYGVLRAEAKADINIMKCDMCISTATGSPQCVAKCPMDAITLEGVSL